MLGQPGIIEDQDTIGHRMQLQQALHACFIQLERVPGRIGQQMLQPLDGGSCDHIGDGVTGLVGQIGEQPRQVALHALSARVSSEQWGKWLQEGRQFG